MRIFSSALVNLPSKQNDYQPQPSLPPPQQSYYSTGKKKVAAGKPKAIYNNNNNNNNNNESVSHQQQQQPILEEEPKVTISMDSFLKILDQYNKQQKLFQQYDITSGGGGGGEWEEPYIVREIKVSGEELQQQQQESTTVHHSARNSNLTEEELCNNVHSRHTGAQLILDFHVDVMENIIMKTQQEIWRRRKGGNKSATSKWKRRSWTRVDLLKNIRNNVSLRRCLIERQQQQALHTRNPAVVDQEEEAKEAQEEEEDQQQQQLSGEDLECHIGILENSIVMLCGEPGLYRVRLEVEATLNFSNYSDCEPFSQEYSATSPKQLTLYFASKAVKNELDFKIRHEDVQVKITPALFVNRRRVPIDSSGDEEKQEYITQVSCTYPATDTLSINWTPKIKTQPSPLVLVEEEVEIEDDKEKKQQLPLTVSSQQNTLHAIGEGLVKSTAAFDYSIVNGSITQLEIVINPYGLPFKVLSVHGKGIKKWNVYDLKDLEHNNEETAQEEEISSLEDAEQLHNKTLESKKVLKIQFQYGIERSYHLKIQSEQEMGGTSAKVYVPSFTSQSVTRETGTLAVVARTNVEIKEESRKYLRKIDNTELPAVQRQSPFPILHSYKFLEKGQELYLNVTRHDDLEVLCACIEKCVYDITLSSGKLLHKLRMTVKNTAKQYLRLRLFNKAEIWSTTVDGQTVKPSSETHKDSRIILIPLSKKEASSVMNVEFVYTVPTEMLEGRGSLRLELAKFDTPVNVLQLSLYLPKDYNYSEFEGDIAEVNYFTYTPSIQSLMATSMDDILSRGEQLDQAREELCVSSQQFLKKSKALGGGGLVGGLMKTLKDTAGLKPVNLGSIDSTTGQKQFKFERFLVLENQSISLSVDYKEIKKGFFERRSTSGSQFSTYFITLLVLLFALVLYRFVL